MKDENMNKKASSIWAMLDQMSASDPAAYRKFIDDQMKMGRTMFEPPKIKMILKFKTLNQKCKHLFAVLCSWIRIPTPKELNDKSGEKQNISNQQIMFDVFQGKPYQLDPPKSDIKIQPLAFCAEFFNLDNHVDGQNEVNLLVRDYLAKMDTSCDIESAPYDIVQFNVEVCNVTQLVGSMELLFHSLGFKESDQFEVNDKDGSIRPKRKPSSDKNLFDDILKSVKSGGNSGDFNESECDAIFPESNESHIKMPDFINLNNYSEPNRSLIAEILPSPTVEFVNKKSKLKVSLLIKGMQHVNQCELEISNEAFLCAPADPKIFNFEEMKFEFPVAIQSEQAVARFARNDSLLIIKAPILK